MNNAGIVRHRARDVLFEDAHDGLVVVLFPHREGQVDAGVEAVVADGNVHLSAVILDRPEQPRQLRSLVAGVRRAGEGHVLVWRHPR